MSLPPPLPTRPKSLTKARNCVLLNLAGTPGLGTLMCGRKMVGLLQLALALAGFCLVVAWFVVLLKQFYGMMSDSPAQFSSPARYGWTGAGLFAIAWVWSLFTSLSILRQARREDDALNSIPPHG